MALPAATIAEGILGLESWITWGWPGLERITLNARNYPVQTTWPFYKVRTIGGLYALADAEDNKVQRGGRQGELVYPRSIGGKTITYEGFVIGRTLPELRAAETAMRRAFADVRDIPTPMWHRPHPSRGGIACGYGGYVLDLDITDGQEVGPGANPSPHQRAFTLGIRCMDPRFYAEPQRVVNGLADGATEFLPNIGSAPSEPLFRIAGASATVTITNTDTGQKLVLSNVNSKAGETLIVDFDARTVYIDGTGEDKSAYIDDAVSNWWDDGAIPLPIGGANVRVDGGPWGYTYYDRVA